ncbi:monovalent cation/H+ antiporter subunit A, partial [Salmonella enterica subsp. enterica serovar Typhi]|nr:monovalent cation/H+ antiporter subunit A [Salmonella enterica subsp. enterica serovar Typhi]
FVASLASAIFPSRTRNPPTWIALAATLSCTILTMMLYPAVSSGEIVRREIEWIPELGLAFTLRVDGFAWLFAMMISVIGLLVVIYSRYYISADDSVRRFYFFFLAFMGAMLGVVISGNLIVLVIFWELTSIFSFMLISYWHQNASARDGARMALTVTGIGGLALLGAVLIIGHIVGSYDLDRVLDSGNLIRSSPLYVPALLLFLLGAFTKSAQF